MSASTVTTSPIRGGISLGSLGSRSWMAIGVGVSVLLLVVTWFLLISPTRSDTAELRGAAADIEMQNLSLNRDIAGLRAQDANRGQLAADLRTALTGLPPGTQLPILTRQIAAHADANGVALTGVSIGSPSAPGSDGAATSTDATVLSIPITVTSTGSVLAQLYFLRDLQQSGPRLALVTSTSVAPGQGATDDGSIVDSATMTVQLTVFTRRLPSQTRTQLAGLLDDQSAS